MSELADERVGEKFESLRRALIGGFNRAIENLRRSAIARSFVKKGEED